MIVDDGIDDSVLEAYGWRGIIANIYIQIFAKSLKVKINKYEKLILVMVFFSSKAFRISDAIFLSSTMANKLGFFFLEPLDHIN